MLSRRQTAVLLITTLFVVAAGAVWFVFQAPASIPPVEPAAPTSASYSESLPLPTEPVAESRAACAMVRAAGGTVLISKFGQVKVINLTGCRISDDDLRHLAATPDLILLNLDGATVGDAGLAYICDLSELKILRLCRTSVTDAGLGRLSGLPSLDSLHLDETRITDEGLRQLGNFPSLTSINALGCPVTDQAERIVRERMPGCRVKH